MDRSARDDRLRLRSASAWACEGASAGACRGAEELAAAEGQVAQEAGPGHVELPELRQRRELPLQVLASDGPGVREG